VNGDNEMLSEEFETLKFYVDSVAGVQAAQTVAINCLLGQYRGNAVALESLTQAFELMRANLIASKGSDYKLEQFNAIAEVMIESLRP
jgi:hypothetical protein